MTVRPPMRTFVTTVVVLVLSASVEELVFRVGAIALLDGVAGDAVAVAVSAAVFAVIHAVRGSGWEERTASVATAFAFGVVLGATWVETRSFLALVAFHTAFNVVGGIVLGWGALDPISRRSATPTWPFALEDGTRWRRGGSGVVLYALPELAGIGVAAVVLASAA